MCERRISSFYRPAKPDDFTRAMNGQEVEARFRNEDDEEWRDGEYLGGILVSHRKVITWIDRDTMRWKQCHVYDPPEYWKNQPDPGEGYRLLKKFPHEDLLPTDEAKWPCDGKWHVHKEGNGKQIEEMWYRRRIANSPASSDSCEASVYRLTEGELIQLPNGNQFRVTKRGFEVTL
jgi:hypothetical protein